MTAWPWLLRHHSPGNIRNALRELLAPDFYPKELAHVLTGAERQGGIAVGSVGVFWAEATPTPPVLV